MNLLILAPNPDENYYVDMTGGNCYFASASKEKCDKAQASCVMIEDAPEQLRPDGTVLFPRGFAFVWFKPSIGNTNNNVIGNWDEL